MKRIEYPVLLIAAAEGGFVVTCRDLPQLIAQGEDIADALTQAADAMDEVFVTYMLERMEFPAPSAPKRNERMVSPPAGTVAKAALYVATREAQTIAANWNALNARHGSFADEHYTL